MATLKSRLLALKKLHEAGPITVINLVALQKAADGSMTLGQYSDLTPEERQALGVIAGGLVGYGAAGAAGAKAGAQAMADRQASGAAAACAMPLFVCRIGFERQNSAWLSSGLAGLAI